MVELPAAEARPQSSTQPQQLQEQASPSHVTAENAVPSSASTSSLFDIRSHLQGNPYFSAGFGLMLFGGAIAASRKGLIGAASATQRRMLVSLEIPSKDRAHPWFLHWMGAQAEAQAQREVAVARGELKKESLLEMAGFAVQKQPDIKGFRNPLTLAPEGIGAGDRKTTTGSSLHGGGGGAAAAAAAAVSPVRIRSHELSVETTYVPLSSSKDGNAAAADRGQARFSLVPGPGTHWFRYRGAWMKMHRERNEKMVDLHTGAPWETVTLTTLRIYAPLFSQMLGEARALALASTEGKTVIYTSWNTEWRPFGKPRRTRTLESVVLTQGTKERIVADVKRFLGRGKWYADRGVPYRRGYLLHGAPGSGKTSFITALAGSLDFNICVLNLSERGLSDDKLHHLLAALPERSILLLEDVDAAFAGREAAPDGFVHGVTFSGLLNGLDGVASGESRIVFMTTNHVERLDPALIRPGRVDLIEELADAAPEQVERLLLRFYDFRSYSADAVPLDQTLTDSLATSSTQQQHSRARLEQIAQRLASAVEQESTRRRQSLGLDPGGRYMEPSSSPTSSSVSSRATSAMGALTHPGSAGPSHPLPAAKGGVSMAELQGLFIRFPDDPEAALQAFVHEGSE